MNNYLIKDVQTNTQYYIDRAPHGDWQVNTVKQAHIPALLNQSDRDMQQITANRTTYDFRNRDLPSAAHSTVSLYIPPAVLQHTTAGTTNMPTYIGHLLWHLCGEEQAVFDHLQNALAVMVQSGRKLRSTFLFRGVNQSGWKCCMETLLPLMFGRDYCVNLYPQQRRRKPKILRFLATNYVTGFPDFHADFTQQLSEQARFVDEWVTQSGVQGTNGRLYQLTGNLFCHTEFENSVRLPTNDRRFTVTPYQRRPLDSTTWWPG